MTFVGWRRILDYCVVNRGHHVPCVGADNAVRCESVVILECLNLCRCFRAVFSVDGQHAADACKLLDRVEQVLDNANRVAAASRTVS